MFEGHSERCGALRSRKQLIALSLGGDARLPGRKAQGVRREAANTGGLQLSQTSRALDSSDFALEGLYILKKRGNTVFATPDASCGVSSAVVVSEHFSSTRVLCYQLRM